MQAMTEKDNGVRARSALACLLLSGVLGFVAGAGGAPSWQDTLEPTQVLAGVVHYPLATNPMYLYCVKTWTILHQFGALLLRLGFSERLLSFLFSGLMGMVSYQAAALCLLAVSGSVGFALLSTLVIHSAALYSGGITYGIGFVGSCRTYGVIGLSYSVLVIGLLSLRCYRLGGVLLGLAVAVHPTMGVWLTALVCVVLLADRQLRSEFLRGALPFLVAGWTMTAFSLGIHFLSLRQMTLPAITSQEASRYFHAFINHWDHHRYRFPLSRLRAVIPGVVIAGLWLWPWRNRLGEQARLLVWSVLVAALLAGVFSSVYWLPSEKVPVTLLALMPSRLFNLTILGSVLLVLGLLWRYKDLYLCQCLLLMLAVTSYQWHYCLVAAALALVVGIWFLRTVAPENQRGLAVVLISLAVGFSLGWVMRFYLHWEPYVTVRKFYFPALVAAAWWDVRRKQWQWLQPEIVTTLRRMSIAGFLVGVVALGGALFFAPKTDKFSLYDHSHDQLCKAISRGKGTLLVGSALELVQLRTRRPILLNGANIDTITYVPESAPEVNRILTRVYGIDIFHPPEETRRMGGLARDSGRVLWEGRSPQEWKALANAFGFTEIVTYADWQLQLPKISTSREFALYAVSEPRE